ncbi:hypothetical protein HPP92_005667 [Vanilla planifolia]|uniref:3,4-dihydroxy-2-butanone-4-phosphate synthase n=1 Tax=Vanilla planifolia TaxID=51239 RepID=A0A835RZA1_VANPL|nr:hypothetical protein HPP92_005667 [Vanilla planifolia]
MASNIDSLYKINGQENLSLESSIITEHSVNDAFLETKDEQDLDSPTHGFSSIPDAIEDVRQGKLVIVVDDEDREMKEI